MNPNATEFVPTSELQKLWGFPFFQQRLERFLYTQHRITKMRIEDLQLLMPFPPIQAQQKRTVVFVGSYGNISLLYEADRWDDPRTGAFLKLA